MVAIAVATFEIYGWKFKLIHWATDAIACTQVTLVGGNKVLTHYFDYTMPAPLKEFSVELTAKFWK